MELSKRLQAVADLQTHGMRVADVGTDHGYIPIYLIESGKSDRAIAMDINAGLLLRAKEHIVEHGLSDKIETRQSDGVKTLKPDECDCVIVAGMGGGLVIKILEEGKEVFKNLTEFVLQPQSEIEKVREYLYRNDYCITEENMVLEDGKFYPMMKVINRKAPKYNITEFRYGKLLLEEKHPVLKLFLEKEVQTKEKILKNLEKETGEHIEVRKEELRREVSEAKEALRIYL